MIGGKVSVRGRSWERREEKEKEAEEQTLRHL
jgi:hypothetical protein